MRTIEFNNEDIKECKLALLRQDLTSLQSAFLMQHITNLEQALNEIKEYVKLMGKFDGESCTRNFKMMSADFNYILQIIDKYLGGSDEC